MRPVARLICVCAAVATAPLTGCSSELSSGAAPRAAEDVGADAGGGGGGGTSADASADLPPENEEQFDFQRPQTSLDYVYVANTTLNSVARIDSLTLSVTPVEVCLEPIEVAALPTRDRAVTLCRGDHQVAVIDSSPSGDVVSYAWVPEGSNRLLLNPTGEYALVWFDEARLATGDTPGNPQDFTLVVLDGPEGPTSYLLSVGFSVQSVQFDADGLTAFVTTEDGLSVVPLDGIQADQFLPVLSLGDDPLAHAEDREVAVTDDGALAFVRTSTYAGLRVLDTSTGDLSDVPLPAVPTDLDLFPGGGRAIAVLRDAQSVAVLPLPEAVDDPGAIDIIPISDAVVGLAQLAAGGDVALLYSPAAGSSRLVRLDLSRGGQDTFELRKAITGVALSPQGDRALVFQARAPGTPVPGEPINDFLAKTPGYTLFDVASGFARLVQSPTDPGDVAFTDSGEEAFVLLADAAAGVHAVQWVHFDSFRVDTLELERLPEAIGVVPATGRVWVSELAESGRITFIDTATGRQEHVTAYQLNRRIE